LISFGDTMTALLAFFIVLNSLAKEQTGAKMHAGTGSFKTSTQDTFGLANKIGVKRSKQPFQLESNSPKYVVPDPDGKSEPNPKGPDDNPDDKRIIDRQKEEFHRFLQEVRRLKSEIEREPSVAGEATFDVLSKIPSEGSVINKDLLAALKRVAPMLRRGGHEVEIIVWSTMPSEGAWTRGFGQAKQIREETVALLGLPPNQRKKLTATSRPWFSETLKRPTVTVALRRIE